MVKDGFGEGKHLAGSMSIDHPSKPVGKDNVRALAKVTASMYEENPNGSGTKTLEFRHIDLGGSLP